MENTIKLTVFFDNMFWVGVLEKSYNHNYEICKIIFGPEPTDTEIYDFIINNFNKLHFSKPITTSKVHEKKINPKRLQKKIKEETKENGIGTKAQNAIKLQHDESKYERKKISKEKKELLKEKKFNLKQAKKKEKHKGH